MKMLSVLNQSVIKTQAQEFHLSFVYNGWLPQSLLGDPEVPPIHSYSVFSLHPVKYQTTCLSKFCLYRACLTLGVEP